MFTQRFYALVAFLLGIARGYEVLDAIVAEKELDHMGLTMHVYAPNSTEKFPVIFFATGFGCAVPASLYSKMLSGIVSEGYIVAGVYHRYPHVPAYIKDGKHLNDIMEWAKQGNLLEAMANAKLTAVPDVINRSAVMGQSAGNHIVGQALTDGCSVAKAFVMIDPVDGFDPFRIVKGEDLIKPGAKVTFDIPALLIDNGLDPKSVSRFYPPCAPPNVSNDHFYNAWRGPIWNINATEYGHVDCLDTPNGALCPTDKHMDKDLYRGMLADAVTTFLDALFNGKPDEFSKLEESSQGKLMGVDVVLKQDLKGKSHSQITPGCANVGPPADVVV